jgi:hypothetical protein
MILSASRRTDIPCYYSEWFMNRIRAGSVCMRNPMNRKQLSRIRLTPETVDCIVFWTKDARNILDKLPELDRLGYKYYFQFTLTPYDRTIEKNLCDKAEIIETFIRLSNQIGKKRVIWRYDPIILNETIDIAYHKEQFEFFCGKLTGHTETVTISFVDMYPKLKTNLIRPLSGEEIAEISAFLGAQAKAHNLKITACCEKTDLTRYGIEKASCIDKNLIERICGHELDAERDKNQREGCGCCKSNDIGSYNSCLNGCIYCYATDSPASAERRSKAHNPQGELLIGTVGEGELIFDK